MFRVLDLLIVTGFAACLGFTASISLQNPLDRLGSNQARLEALTEVSIATPAPVETGWEKVPLDVGMPTALPSPRNSSRGLDSATAPSFNRIRLEPSTPGSSIPPALGRRRLPFPAGSRPLLI